jgi:hypothetical protein
MSQRVLATDAAKDAAVKLQSLLNGDMQKDLKAVDADGAVLADPNQWDGPRAITFRTSEWPQHDQAINSAIRTLETIGAHAQSTIEAIQAAGGAGGHAPNSHPGPHPGAGGGRAN